MDQTKKAGDSIESKDVIRLTVGFIFEGVDEQETIQKYPEYLMSFGIYKEREMNDVYTKVTQWMEKEFSY